MDTPRYRGDFKSLSDALPEARKWFVKECLKALETVVMSDSAEARIKSMLTNAVLNDIPGAFMLDVTRQYAYTLGPTRVEEEPVWFYQLRVGVNPKIPYNSLVKLRIRKDGTLNYEVISNALYAWGQREVQKVEENRILDENRRLLGDRTWFHTYVTLNSRIRNRCTIRYSREDVEFGPRTCEISKLDNVVGAFDMAFENYHKLMRKAVE